MSSKNKIYFSLRIKVLAIGIAALVLLISGCSSNNKKGEKGITSSKNYSQAVSDFYIGLAAAQTDQANFAYNKMFQITKLYPKEPAVWANLGVFAMRQGNYDLAQKRFKKAISLVPKNANIHFLYGILYSQEGQIQDAVKEMKKAAQLNPDDPLIQFSLIKELERQSSSDNKGEIQQIFDQLNKIQPGNLAVMVEQIRFAILQKDMSTAQKFLNKLANKDKNWSKEIKQRIQSIKENVTKNEIHKLSTQIAFLDHDLRQLPVYQKDLSNVQLPSNQIGFLITSFLYLPAPKASASKIDSKLSFKEQPVSLSNTNRTPFIRTLSLQGGRVPQLLYVEGNKLQIKGGAKLNFPGNEKVKSPQIAVLDYNYDFKNDVCLAGSKGLKLYQQTSNGHFKDVAHSLGLSSKIINEPYRAVWRADLDLDGDLDLLMAPVHGKSFELRNNGDGTFKKVSFLDDASNIKEFKWADLDNDGDADAAILTNKGQIELYMNQRLGHFREVNKSELPDSVVTFTIADLNGDSQFSLVFLQKSGKLKRCYYDSDNQKWETKSVGEWPDFSQIKTPSNAKIFVQDFDNNGHLDVMATAGGQTRVWLNDPDGKLHLMKTKFSGTVYSVDDMNGNGRLDWVGMSAQGKPAEWINNGSSKYNGEIIRPRASNPVGDRRINSFGIGGVLEARSGLIYQRQPINSPLVHFGLGTYSQADMLRIIWPNGSVQAEFAGLGGGSTITNRQSLKGSCPWLFAYNGKKMNFITDILWRSPLGLRLNAQKTAAMGQAKDWVTVRGDQLKPKNGFYDLDITAELWETHFFDYVSLMTVDHPKNTHIFVDERFSIPPPKLKVYVTGPLHNIKRAWDQNGKNVTNLINKKDGKYLGDFKLTKYQGVAKKHYITLDLGSGLPEKGPLWLIAYGWVYPTDSSINVAISQGKQKPPEGLQLQISDGHGGWKTVNSKIGFPAGKNKTVLINLEGLFHHKGDHKVRLVTSTQTYWDAIWWAQGKPNAKIKTHRILPTIANLRYRGYSKLIQKTEYSPQVPDYQDITGTTPKWSDLVGFYTRYGNVKPLLHKIDNRYVIMNAGDEMRLKFKDSTHPPKNYKRDFVFISNGWEKDGDYNTTFSKTVIPLPSHNETTYNTPPTTLQNDPVYQKHKKDWIKYQTRYITPQPFYKALLFGKEIKR